jgi:hypothetical protein
MTKQKASQNRLVLFAFLWMATRLLHCVGSLWLISYSFSRLNDGGLVFSLDQAAAQ